MALTVLNVAYPFAPVGPDAVGGAEQILAALDAGLTRAGGRSLVLACEGSHCAGELRPGAVPEGAIDDALRAQVWSAWAQKIAEIQRRETPDIVHLHGIDFAHYLPERGTTLVTLHLPLDWYAPETLRPSRPDLWLHGVSERQCARAPEGARLEAPMANGVDLERFFPDGERGDYALFLGRICPEKAPHLAIAAASAAGAPLLLAGRTFAYEAHRRYFDQEVAPRLSEAARLIGPVGGEPKRRLLSGARCLLVPSLAEETSSLVAMEALACGVPVVAFRRGALPDLIEHGRTGFVVDDVEQMAEALPRCADLSSQVCRAAAVQRFSGAQMVARYLALYAQLAGHA